MEKEKSSEKKIVSECPITGLPVCTRDSWDNIKIDETFSISFSVIGKNIFTVHPVGRASAETVLAVLKWVDEIINENFSDCDNFIIIENFEGLKKVTLGGRKRYLEYYHKLKNLKAVIVCTSSPLMQFSVKLAARFNTWHYIAVIEKNYEDSLNSAMKFLEPEPGEFEKSQWGSAGESLYGETCPFTGLPVVRKAEWIRVDLGGPQVSFSVIGGKILAVAFYNWRNVDVTTYRKVFAVRKKVVDQMFGPDEKFVEIRDYSAFSKGPSKRLRAEFRSLIKPDKDRIIAFIGYNAPLSVRISFSAGQCFYSSPFPWKTVKNYNEAVNLALLFLTKKGYEIPQIHNVLAKDEWCMSFEGYEVRYEIINGDIIHRISKGFLMPDYVDEAYRLQCLVLQETGLFDKPHYFINNVLELKGLSFKARKRYFRALIDWSETYPGYRLAVIYGANRMIRAGLAIANYLRPYRMTVCDSIDDALMYIANDKAVMLGGVAAFYSGETGRINRNTQYSNEIIRFLGNINWETDGDIEFSDSVSQAHPFKAVFDAITLIKSDIDELFREHGKTKSDLEESKRIANVLAQEIIKAQENERQRIARDLHDNVAQDLASLIIANDGLLEGLDEIPHELKRRVMKNSRTLKRAIESIRDLAYDLRPPSLDQLGLVKTLTRYCNDFQEANMLSVDFYSAGVGELDLDFDTEINIYRVTQEALNNIKKHANASYVSIHLITSFPNIILKIEDDGDGFNLDKRWETALKEKRMGLKSMEERARLLSGEFTIRSLAGKGTMIRLTLPFTGGHEE